MKVKRVVIIILFILIILLSVYFVNIFIKLEKLKKMTFDDMILYTTKNMEDAKISVGIIKDNEISYIVYGENGSKIDNVLYDYEIGSITKTFTTTLLCKAIEENKLEIKDSIDKYLDLDKDKFYPNLENIVSHTAGYKEYYFDTHLIMNFLKGNSNSYNGITKDKILNKVKNLSLGDKSYNFKYSNFGISVIGLVLEKIYNQKYSELMNDFMKRELELSNTIISTNEDNSSDYWEWQDNDGYIPSGAIISNIEDMLKYLDIQINEKFNFISTCHKPLKEVNNVNNKYKLMGIRIDKSGYGWMFDEKNNIIWHNGATSNYNSYLAFDKEQKIGVVILSNLSPDYKIPSTIMGLKLINELKKHD